MRISQMNDEFKFFRVNQSFPKAVVVTATPLLISHQNGQEEKPDICTKPYLAFMIAARSSK